MWIKRGQYKQAFINKLLNLNRQVILLQGARQVGKTSFALNILSEIEQKFQKPNLRLNLMYTNNHQIDGVDYLGRKFFGDDPNGEEFISNLNAFCKSNFNPDSEVFVLLDEVDRYPQVMESVQLLAEYHKQYKFIFTGSNLENLATSNAATGRKLYFDLYPLSFLEFLLATDNNDLYELIKNYSLTDKVTEYYHNKAMQALDLYIRLGGMPRVITSYLKEESISQTIKDLANSIEENVKLILGEKAKLYEYQDVLRIIAHQSLDTLKLNRLQVQHAGRSEAKRLLSKTVGARVAHKVRLWGAESDLSKYILFDTGIVNFLIAGADLLSNKWQEKQKAIMLETFIANSLVNETPSREDIFYWKSGNKAEVEFCLHSPYFVGIDVKTQSRRSNSLCSMALNEKDLDAILLISPELPELIPNYIAKLSSVTQQRKIPLLKIPPYLMPRLFALLKEVCE